MFKTGCLKTDNCCMHGSHDGEQGFTLIELLVVVIVIGILAAIAIPTFLKQREKAFRTTAISDMKNVSIALETYGTDHDGDYSGMNGADETTPALTDEGFNDSQWVSLSVTADGLSYCVIGVNEKVPGKQFVLRSDDGGAVQLELRGSPSC
jgi:type IV pilus assembly protein PilA